MIISSSARVNGNSSQLAQALQEGAKASGNEVTLVHLAKQEVKFCIGCLSCQKTHRCVLNDSVENILQTMRQADVIVYATPVYFYEMSGLLKTFLDRSNPLYGQSYQFKKVYLLASAADDGEDVFVQTINGLKGWVRCFSGVTYEGGVMAGGVSDCGDVQQHKALQEAYALGRSI